MGVTATAVPVGSITAAYAAAVLAPGEVLELLTEDGETLLTEGGVPVLLEAQAPFGGSATTSGTLTASVEW